LPCTRKTGNHNLCSPILAPIESIVSKSQRTGRDVNALIRRWRPFAGPCLGHQSRSISSLAASLCRSCRRPQSPRLPTAAYSGRRNCLNLLFSRVMHPIVSIPEKPAGPDRSQSKFRKSGVAKRCKQNNASRPAFFRQPPTDRPASAEAWCGVVLSIVARRKFRYGGGGGGGREVAARNFRRHHPLQNAPVPCRAESPGIPKLPPISNAFSSYFALHPPVPQINVNSSGAICGHNCLGGRYIGVIIERRKNGCSSLNRRAFALNR